MTETNEVRGENRASVETTMQKLFKDLSDRLSEISYRYGEKSL